MQPLNCFARNFSIAPSRLVFDNPEKPHDSPPAQGETRGINPQELGAKLVGGANENLNAISSPSFEKDTRNFAIALTGNLKDYPGPTKVTEVTVDPVFHPDGNRALLNIHVYTDNGRVDAFVMTKMEGSTLYYQLVRSQTYSENLATARIVEARIQNFIDMVTGNK